jgi:Secretion system C-terminal sorting domain
MKKHSLALMLFASLQAQAQSPITTINAATTTAVTNTTYVNGVNTYNWGLSPNNNVVNLNGFSAGGLDYSYANALNGIIKIRRVDNAGVTGNLTLVWAETSALNSFNMLPEFESNMEMFFDGRTYNKGTDNFFDNTSATNKNNVERLDWVLTGGYATASPNKVGFTVFERGVDNNHDPFCMAAILSLDASGNPASYGPIVRVATAQFGNIPTSALNYRILKGPQGTNLLDAGTNNQARGGVFLSYATLGISANTTVYGYSLFANDVPAAATPANLIDFTNATYFPTNTGNAGGIDLVGVTGIYIETTLLASNNISVSAALNNNITTVYANVEDEQNVKEYEVERSADGQSFETLKKATAKNNNATAQYIFEDDITNFSKNIVYYRVKQIKQDGSFVYSKIVTVKTNNKLAINIFPNPTTKSITLNFFSAKVEKVVVHVFDAKGKMIKQLESKIFKGQNIIPVNDLDNLPKGIYYIKVSNETKENIAVSSFEKI